MKKYNSLVAVDVGILNTIKEAIILYYSKTNDDQNRMFYFNGKPFHPNDNRTLDQINIRNSDQITVIETKNIHGA